MNLAVVVIPISKRPLTYLEKISLQQVHNVLKDYPKVFVAPKSFSFDYGIEYRNYTIEYFDDMYFGSADAHNKLLLSRDFYDRFKNYKFMLLYHLDAFVFSDQLKRFCTMGYDYIGAPGTKKFRLNGECFPSLHGGFSLRRIESFREILNEKKTEKEKWTTAEDIFYSWCGNNSNNFSIASKNVALEFSFETYVRKLYRLNGQRLPFGCHAWWKRDLSFYKPVVENYGYSLDSHLVGEVKGNLDQTNRLEKVYQYLFSRLLRNDYNRQKIQTSLNEMFGDKVSYAIFGAGTDGSKFYEEMHKLIKIECFFDNASSKWKKTVYGLPIREPNASFLCKKNIVVFICTISFREHISQQLKNLGLTIGVDFMDANEFQKDVVKKLGKIKHCKGCGW